MAMSRRQIDAARERRLWFRDVIVPTITSAVIIWNVPGVKEAVKSKAAEAKEKFSRMWKSR
jgi:hypothetical protein